MNGSGNGHEPDEQDSPKIVKFPTLADRDRMRREQLAEEKRLQAQYKAERRSGEQFINWHKIPIATRFIFGFILLINVPVLLLLSNADYFWLIYTLGFVPGYFSGTIENVPLISYLSPITHMVLHGGWTHLIMNLVMGGVFTVFFERAYGPRTTVIFFLLCGLAGAAVYFILNPFGTSPVVGASGAISGMFGAVLMLMYQMGQLGAMGKKGPWPVIIFWFAFMVFIGLISGGDLAWQAHAGGYIAGVVLLRALQKGIVRF